MSEFRMPSLGADMEAGTLIEWLKHPGDPVSRGDIIAVVDTQKGAIEIEVFDDGVLEQTLVAPGERVPVGTVLAQIRSARVPAAQPAAPEPTAGPPPIVAPPAPEPIRRPQPAPARPEPLRRIRASPAARALAGERGVDLMKVTGTGPDGAIQRSDVERATAGASGVSGPPAIEPRATDRTGRMRAAIAAAMAKSKREIPHYYLGWPVDMSRALAWLSADNGRRSVAERLLPVVLLIKAVALALREVPELNGHWVDERFRPGAGIHIGCAVALRGGGLVAPAIHDTDAKDLTTLMRELRDVTARARAGTLRSSEVTDATMTVTSLGDQGVATVHGIIYPPQVALVGFGRIVERPWAVSGRVDARPVVTVTLAGDHRASDGHRGGRLLTAIDRRLQEPEAL